MDYVQFGQVVQTFLEDINMSRTGSISQQAAKVSSDIPILNLTSSALKVLQPSSSSDPPVLYAFIKHCLASNQFIMRVGFSSVKRRQGVLTLFSSSFLLLLQFYDKFLSFCLYTKLQLILNETNQDVIEVQILSFNIRGFTKIWQLPFWNYSHFTPST